MIFASFDGPQDDTAGSQIAHTGRNEGDALSGLDQSQDGLHQVGLVDHAWGEAGAAAEPHDPVEELRCPRTMEEDERLVGQVLHAHRLPGGGPMPFGQDGEQGIAVQALRPKPGTIRSQDGPGEPDIEPPSP